MKILWEERNLSRLLYTYCGLCAMCVVWNYCTLIKKKKKFSSHIRKSRWDQLQSHIWGLPNTWGNAQIFNHKWGGRWSIVIYDFAIDPFWISFYMRKMWFSFLSVYSTVTNLVYTTLFFLDPVYSEPDTTGTDSGFTEDSLYTSSGSSYIGRHHKRDYRAEVQSFCGRPICMGP